MAPKNDLEFVIVALENTEAALGRVSERLDALAAKVERLDGKKASVDVDVDTDKANKNIDLIQKRWQAIAAAIVIASPVIGAAIEAGVGAGFVGIAALAEKSNVDVKESYTNLWQNISGTTKNATAQLIPELTGAANSLSQTVTALGPQIKQGMALAGPEIVTLTRGIEDMARNAMPGLLTAMQSNMPVMQALATLMGTVGTVFTNTLTGLSGHSQEFATVLHSLGSITQSVFGLATNLLNDLAVAYATNSAGINTAIASLASTIGNIAQAVLPVLTVALGAASGAITMLSTVLGPVATGLAPVAAAFLAAKFGAGLLESGVNSLLGVWNKVAEKAVDVGNKVKYLAGGNAMASDSFNLLTAAQYKQGVASAEQALATAKAQAVSAKATVQKLEETQANNAAAVSEQQLTEARGAATAAALAETEATAALDAAEKEAWIDAGPIGWIILGVSAALGALMMMQKDTTSSAEGLKSGIDSMTAAFQASHGTIDANVISSTKATDQYKNATDALSKMGVSQEQVNQAVFAGGAGLTQMRESLQRTIDAGTTWTKVVGFGKSQMTEMSTAAAGGTRTLTAQAQAAEKARDSLNQLVNDFAKANLQQEQNERSQRDAAHTTVQSTEYQQLAAKVAQNLGLSLQDVSMGFEDIVAKGGDAASSVVQVAFSYEAAQLKINQATTAISEHFKEVDRAAVEAQQSADDAAHSYDKSAEAITDAHHSEMLASRAVTQAREGEAAAAHAVDQANRALRDAYDGVTTAEENYTKAQDNEAKAQVALNEAREQAVKDLKDLHLQLEDQITAEESAQVRLFEQQQNAAGWGITAANAQQIAAEPVTFSNVDRVKAAIDFVSAENAVNDTLNKGANLREQVADADARGVDGAKNVVSAQDQLRNSQDQVRSSALALQKAHEQVGDATYSLQQAQQNLTKSHEAVTDAAYNLQKAHLAVQDAEYARDRSAAALQLAQQKLKDAQDDTSRSLDLNTRAGQNNMGLILQLWDSITAKGGPSLDNYRQLIDDVATAFGISKDKAQEMLDKINAFKPEYKFGITAMSNVDLSGLPNVWQAILGNQPSASDQTQLNQLLGLPPLPLHATGGPITGLGGPRDDANLIWASAGEFMQPADAVAHYGTGFMEAVRQKRFPRGAALPAMAQGGSVRDALANVGRLSAMTFNYVVNVQAMDAMGLPHPPLPKEWVPPAVPVFTGVGGVSGDRAGNRAVVMNTFATMFGWGSPAEQSAIDYLMMRESGYNNTAQNPTSTAYGAFQFLDTTWAGYGIPKTSDIGLQAIAGGRYIRARYGDPIGAAAHERAFNWYADGDIITRPTVGVLGEAGPEVVLPLNRPQRARALADQAGIGERHYHLTVYNAANNEINLRAQFKRLEIESGML